MTRVQFKKDATRPLSISGWLAAWVSSIGTVGVTEELILCRGQFKTDLMSKGLMLKSLKGPPDLGFDNISLGGEMSLSGERSNISWRVTRFVT